MSIEKPTTQVNPGAFQKRKKTTLRRFGGQLYKLMRQQEWKSAGNFLLSEGMNILHERNLAKSGQKLLCPICGFKSHYFINSSNAMRIAWQSACPNCNSRGRHRGLKFLYEEILMTCDLKNVLHFAPEPVLMPIIKQFEQIEYQTTDYFLEDVDYPKEDIQKLSFSDAQFDLVLCNHVIEHVPDDQKAISELARILRRGGKAIISIPGDWNRAATVYFKGLRYNGHYRDYGMDVLELLQPSFSEVVVKDLHDYNWNSALNCAHGIRNKELAFICTK